LNKHEIQEIISKYLEEYFEVPKENIHLNAKLYMDLGLDSIDAIDLIVKLQELTKKKIDPQSFKQVHTIGDLVDKIYELAHEQ
jgi:acyl carrier protein